MVCGDLYQRQGDLYTQKVDDYLSSVEWYTTNNNNNSFRALDFPDPDKWLKYRRTPSAEMLKRDTIEMAKSNNTPSGISDKMRWTREMQSVKCSTSFVFDFTFSFVKNYSNTTATAAATCMSDGGEVPSVVLVRSTKLEEAKGAIEAIGRRPDFAPKVVYPDTHPHNKDYWENKAFSSEPMSRLGLFHFIQRLTKEMDPDHVFFGSDFASYEKLFIRLIRI